MHNTPIHSRSFVFRQDGHELSLLKRLYYYISISSYMQYIKRETPLSVKRRA